MQVGQCTLKAQAPFVDDADVTGDLLYFGQQVTGEKDGHPELFGQPHDQVPHLLDAAGIEAVGGLVQDEQLRFAQQSKRQPQSLPHAIGVAADPATGGILQAHDGQHAVDLRLNASGETSRHLQVLAAGQVGIDGRGFDQGSQPGQQIPAVPPQRLAKEPYLPMIGPDQAQQ